MAQKYNQSMPIFVTCPTKKIFIELNSTQKITHKKILFCILNWGLGHATRSTPLIKRELRKGHEVHIASDGLALTLLKEKFPNLHFHELPSYDVVYGASERTMAWTLLWQLPKIRNSINEENNRVAELVKEHGFDRIISDNRLGCYYPEIENIYITHQLRISGGLKGKIATFFHRRAIKNFQKVWIPDDKQHTLSGILSYWKNMPVKKQYIGPLSCLKKATASPEPDIRYLLLLSGPEPQRSILEDKLIDCLKDIEQKIVLVRGTNTEAKTQAPADWEVHNLVSDDSLGTLICRSEFVVARSGYSTIMDLAQFGIKPIFIPTPGQPEQKYLALRLRRKYKVKVIRQRFLKKFNWEKPRSSVFFPMLASRDTRNRVARKSDAKAPSAD